MPPPSSATEFRSIWTRGIVLLLLITGYVGTSFADSLFPGCFDCCGFKVDFDFDVQNDIDRSNCFFGGFMREEVAEDFSLADGQFSKRYLLVGLR